MDYNEIWNYVKEQLKKVKLSRVSSKSQIQYSRYEHIQRVFAWTQRLIAGLPEDVTVMEDVVLTAAIFHDVGYGILEDNERHAEASAEICKEYLVNNHFDKEFTEAVTYLVRNHSSKELLYIESTPMELILLMEADLLDDTGALSVIIDAMVEGRKEVPDFMKTYDHIMAFTNKEMQKNRMVTEPAKRIWQEKQKMTEEFIRQLRLDLNISK